QLVPAARKLELGDDERTDPCEVADREVDLPEQQHEDDAEREERRSDHLVDQVREVDSGEEVRRREAEDDDDDDLADDDRQRAEVARADVELRLGPEPCNAAGELLLLERLGALVLADDVRCRHAAVSGPTVAGMPETLVGNPAVIASTTACWVVARRSKM